jgi:4-hydroxybenzoate polyprenyltransferase
MSKFIVNFLRLTRPLSNVKNIALIVLAFCLSGVAFDWVIFLVGLFSISFVCSSFYIYNTLSDYSLDKNNDNKNHYSGAVDYFGKKTSFIIFILLLVLGFIVGFFVNFYFLFFLTLLALTNFLYSSRRFRFKERFILDILFGASFTFLLRFVALWFVFSFSFPPMLVILALVFAKSAGYLLYKDLDYEYLLALKVKNSVTILGKKTKIIISGILWTSALLSFLLLCLNTYFKIAFLGLLPLRFLLLIPFAIPPIVIIYFSSFGKIRVVVKALRILGFAYWIIVIMFALVLL